MSSLPFSPWERAASEGSGKAYSTSPRDGVQRSDTTLGGSRPGQVVGSTSTVKNESAVQFSKSPSKPSRITPILPPTTPRSTGISSRVQIVIDPSPKTADTLPYHTALKAATPRISSDVSKSLQEYPITMTPHTPAVSSPEDAAALGEATAEPAKRKRGRPKGWRPGVPYSSGKKDMARKSFARAERTKGKPAPNYVLKKRRGRPPRQPSPTPQAIFSKVQPKFVPYICEWHGCRAELQNMATLRKHVMVVHGSHELCKWAKCAALRPQVRLQDRIDFEEHMEQVHLIPFEWHMGDGHRNSTESTKTDPDGEIAPYLLDKDGKQVTPSIRDQELEDHITWRNNRRRLRELLMQRDANAPLEEDTTQGSDPN